MPEKKNIYHHRPPARQPAGMREAPARLPARALARTHVRDGYSYAVGLQSVIS